MNEFTGLTLSEVQQKKSLGLSNQVIDAYTPSRFKIILRNTFNLINIVLIPLLATLVYFQLYSEVLAFGTFAIVNSVVSALDELRAKKQLDKLKEQFQIKTKVIRENEEQEISISEIVEGDYVHAKEGEGIIADGKVLYSNYLQLDESALTGESNYIQKEKDEEVKAGSFVVTGECVYIVESVGKNNYLNKIGTEALKYKEKKSKLQRNGDKLILFLVFASIALGLANFYLTQFSDVTIQSRILSLTTIIVLIIPQTLIFLFTLTFTISITKLYNKGVLIQKGGSIEELSNINVICFDKTGTITTNNMKILDTKLMNIGEEEIGGFYNSVREKIVGVNKTQALLNDYFGKYKKVEFDNFDQVPFTSKQKYSLVTAQVKGTYKTLVFGAYTVLQDKIDEKLNKDIGDYVTQEELKGNRVLIGIFTEGENPLKNKDLKTSDQPGLENLQPSKNIIVFSIEEELNPGIKDILNQLKSEELEIKIISGDSLNSVKKILQKIGIDDSQAVDLSASENNLEELALTKTVFTRAKPEDKLAIIKALQMKGKRVAMSGDGINDVLSIKAADVSISMEHGSKIARDTADIVLLNNDFSKVPMIFFEGENILYNLKLSTKLFLFKSFAAIMTGLYFTIMKLPLPIDPSSTLIFSFLGSSTPSYVIVFTRQKVQDGVTFFRDVLSNTIPQSAAITAGIIYIYYFFKDRFYSPEQINTSIIIFILIISLLYSLHQIWLSKKLRNLIYSAAIFTVLVMVGIFETILPMTQYDNDLDRIVIILFVLLGGSILMELLAKTLKPSTLKKKIGIAVLSFIWTPLVLYFPFNDYYHVIRLSVDIYAQIGLIALIVFIGIILVTRIFKVNPQT